MSEWIAVARESGIGIITVQNPPVNALSPEVAAAIEGAMSLLGNDPKIRAIVLIGGGRTFIAGADIKEFVRMASGSQDRKVGLESLMNSLENSSRPVICAIHGTALGGGLETAMACHYRIADPAARIGQPEVKLGLIPGAGGTQRLPRLAGLRAALSMCTTGEPVTASEALKLGIIDRLAEGDLRACAVQFASEMASGSGSPRRTREMVVSQTDMAEGAEILSKQREKVRKEFRGRLAPLKAIDAIEASLVMPFEEGIRREAELFDECLISEQSKALIHIFFAEREAGRIPGAGKGTRPRDIAKIAIIGAGRLGREAAALLTSAGFPVILKDVHQPALDSALNDIRKLLDGLNQQEEPRSSIADQRMALIRPTLSYEGIAEADFVLEAVTEDPEVKIQVFHELGRICWPEAILASATTGCDLERLAAATPHPYHTLGFHFFTLPLSARAIEIASCSSTLPEALSTAMALAKKAGKIGILTRGGAGYLSRRLSDRWQQEHESLLREGALPGDIQSALFQFGIDLSVSKANAEFRDTARGAVTHSEIVERMVFSLIHGGITALQDRAALRASDIDVLWVHGFGFPSHRGGPMWFAETLGLVEVSSRIREFCTKFGPRWQPPPLLETLVREGGSLFPPF